jgi:tRNA (guanine-N7-)-methyltransferase
LGRKNKLQRFAENRTFKHYFQLSYEDAVSSGFPMKGKWNSSFFKNDNPIVLELGCGKGEYSVGLARRFPGKNFIGIDVKGARLWRGLKSSFEEGLKNIAFVRTRIELIEYIFDKNEVDEIWITFPDPQIKESREKKRLTSPLFLNRYKTFLKKGGIVHLKTDALLLYDYTLDIIKKNGYELIYANEDIYNSDLNNEVVNIQTFYEQKWLSYNTPIKYLAFKMD